MVGGGLLAGGVDPGEDGRAGAAEEADVLEALRGEDRELQPRRRQFVVHCRGILRRRRARVGAEVGCSQSTYELGDEGGAYLLLVYDDGFHH